MSEKPTPATETKVATEQVATSQAQAPSAAIATEAPAKAVTAEVTTEAKVATRKPSTATAEAAAPAEVAISTESSDVVKPDHRDNTVAESNTQVSRMNSMVMSAAHAPVVPDTVVEEQPIEQAIKPAETKPATDPVVEKPRVQPNVVAAEASVPNYASDSEVTPEVVSDVKVETEQASPEATKEKVTPTVPEVTESEVVHAEASAPVVEEVSENRAEDTTDIVAAKPSEQSANPDAIEAEKDNTDPERKD